jgi:hypothetical protein
MFIILSNICCSCHTALYQSLSAEEMNNFNGHVTFLIREISKRGWEEGGRRHKE